MTDTIIDRTDSCEISINAKGQLSAKIKHYDVDIDKAIEKTIVKAEEMKRYVIQKNAENAQ